MIIGVETSALTPKPTGTSRYIQCFLDQLRLTDHEVKTFTPFVTERNRSESNHFGSWQRHWYRTFRLADEMHQGGVDAGIFPNYLMPAGFQKRAAVVIHDLSFLSHPQFYSRKFVWYYSDQIRRTLKQDPLIVTLTEHTRHEIRKHLAWPDEKIQLVQAYSHMKRPEVIISRPEDCQPYFLFVGHIEPRKNLGRLLEAFLRWKQESENDMELRIIGDVWIPKRDVAAMLRRYQGHESIRFMGYVPDEELFTWYAHASAVVHVSLAEGFGFPVLEAMHFGTPIVCSRDSAMEEIAGGRAVTVDPSDTASIARGLELVSRQESLAPVYDIPFSEQRMKRQIDRLVDHLLVRNLCRIGDVEPRAASLEQAVQKTLIFASIFQSGISRDVLRRRLMDVSCTEEELNQAIETLAADGNVVLDGHELRLVRPADATLSAGKTRKISDRTRRRVLLFLKRVPFVHCITASGGFVHGSHLKSEDMDFFVITKPHTVYLVYFMIHMVSLALRWRGILCPNYLVDATALRISHQQDFYTAHQIVCLRSIKNDAGLREFHQMNQWVRAYFPNFDTTPSAVAFHSSLYRFLRPLNLGLMRMYRLIWKKRMARAVPGALQLSPHVIKLHLNDHRPLVKSLFEKAWQQFECSSQTTKIPA